MSKPLGDLAGAGVAGNRLEARIELLHLVVLYESREAIKRKVIEGGVTWSTSSKLKLSQEQLARE